MAIKVYRNKNGKDTLRMAKKPPVSTGDAAHPCVPDNYMSRDTALMV